MSSAIPLSRPDLRAGAPFALAALAVACLSAFLAGWLPLGFSIVTVFLFAGPHNWLEVRYFMGRMPARWGRLRGYFVFAFAGILGLSAIYAGLAYWAATRDWNDVDSYSAAIQKLDLASASWNSAFVLWVATLVQMRSRQNPRRDWSWFWPVAFLLIALTWLDPHTWSLGMVYGHPLIAFWVLDRELKRSRPQWRPAYHLVICAVPILLAALWLRLADAPPLMGDGLTSRIADHAGASILVGINSHLLVATHTFLEMLHYGIWIVVIPLVAYRARPWKLDVPLARRSLTWRRGLLATLVVGLVVVLLLWGCFLADYPLTRDVYFTVALLHVLAEVPFLLRSL